MEHLSSELKYNWKIIPANGSQGLVAVEISGALLTKWKPRNTVLALYTRFPYYKANLIT